MRSVVLIAAIAVAAHAQTAPPPAKPAKQAATAPSWRTLKYPPLREVKVPDVTQHVLSNGMRVFLLENHELPVVSGFALVRTGNLFDPKEKIGLADITGTVMRSGGAKGKNADQLNEQLENIAASVESSIGETSGRVGFNSLKENTDEVLAVFKDVLTAPDFSSDKLDLAKTQEKSAISRRNDSPHAISGREFNNILYGRTTPFGWRQEYATIDAIQREDVVAFHKRYFFPKNIMLAVYGDFSVDDMKAKLEKLFADWTVEQPAVPPFPKVDPTPRPGLNLASKDDVNQTSFLIGHLAGTLRDKDYPALEVMGSVLGGSPFTSRLGSAIRVQRGYAYQIGAAWSANYNHPGIFRIVGGTKSENTVAAIQTIQEEVKKFIEQEPTPAELKSAKDKILNAFVFNFDSPSKTLSRLVTYEYNGYPQDFIFQYQKAVENVTPADVQRVARQYLKPENFTYVLVGKPADFGTPLSALNMPVTNIDLTIPQPKREVSEASPESLAKGKALLGKMVSTLGGAEQLSSLKDYTQNMEADLAQGMKIKVKQFWVAPSVFRQETELPFGKIFSYYDGKGGWVKTPQGEGPLAGPMLRQVEEQVFHDLLELARNGAAPGNTVNYVGEGTLEISNGKGMSTRLTIDEATGVPKKQVYASASGGNVEESYGELKSIGNLKVPGSWTVTQNGKKFADFRLADAQLNGGVSAEALAKKP